MSCFMTNDIYDLSRTVKTFCHVNIDSVHLMEDEIYNRLMKAPSNFYNNLFCTVA